MPGPSLAHRLGLRRPSILERSSQAADSGYWLALRFSPDVSAHQVALFMERWGQTGLLPITAAVLPHHIATSDAVLDDRIEWFEEMVTMTATGVAPPLVPAAAKGAEAFCRDFHGSSIALDESLPDGFTDRCFSNRAERDKSFVRCAKALMTGVVEHRVGRLQLWTRVPRVITACRSAAHTAGLDVGGAYEFCIPETERAAAERLLREGETVRLEFHIDRVVLERTVAR